MMPLLTDLRSLRLSLLCASALILFFPAEGSAQGGVGGGIGENGRIEGRYKIVPIPYVNYNRSIGATFGALPLVMFNPVARDTVSPSSIGGALVMYSTNKTWLAVGFARVHLAEDDWRVTGAGGFGSINFQFYLDNPIGIWVPYNTGASFAFAQVERRIVGRLYGGVSYVYTRFRNTSELAPDTTITTTLNGLGLSASMDTRPNVYYPRTGFFTNVKYFGYPEAFGNDVESNTVDLDYNHYWSLRDRTDVIAVRAFAGLGIGDLASTSSTSSGGGATSAATPRGHIAAITSWQCRPSTVGTSGGGLVWSALAVSQRCLKRSTNRTTGSCSRVLAPAFGSRRSRTTT